MHLSLKLKKRHVSSCRNLKEPSSISSCHFARGAGKVNKKFIQSWLMTKLVSNDMCERPVLKQPGISITGGPSIYMTFIA